MALELELSTAEIRIVITRATEPVISDHLPGQTSSNSDARPRSMLTVTIASELMLSTAEIRIVVLRPTLGLSRRKFRERLLSDASKS